MLLKFTNKGIYCPQADVYIDPWRAVDRALITHGHSDHARSGSRHYLCTHATKPILLHRLGTQNNISSVNFGEKTLINGVQFSFHPAAHVIGSAQIRVEYKGEIWVASGDYKVVDDGISGAFEPVKCHTFITESTFGLPVYQWPDQHAVYGEINEWWSNNQTAGRASVLSAYSLGKAQRIIQNVDHTIGRVFCHGAVENMNAVLRDSGVNLKPTTHVNDETTWEEVKSGLIITPGGAMSGPWMKKFKDVSTASASGWMAIRGRRRWQSVDRGFVLSDHADWKGLNDTIQATQCERVIVTHGYTDVFARWLSEQGLEARTEKTLFDPDNAEDV